MRVVAVEEHCVTPGLRELLGPQIHPYYAWHTWSADDERRIADLGPGRIAEMDAEGVTMQVLGTAQPGLEHSRAEQAIPVAREFNDVIAAAIAANPERFSGLAALATADPGAAASELERAVTALGLKGAMVNNRTLERFMDDPYFWPIYEAAEALEVPLYFHPMLPSREVFAQYYAGFSDAVSGELSGGAWGWHIETGLHAMRLMLAGVFDRFPRLQVILGHMGEAVPFMLGRANGKLLPSRTGCELSLEEYVRRNFHFSISGFFTEPPLRLALDIIGADRIMFGADYPFGSAAEGIAFLNGADITAEERAKILHANADRLLRL